MPHIFKKKSRLEILTNKYRTLMRKSFETALANEAKSKKAKTEAIAIYNQIQRLQLQENGK